MPEQGRDSVSPPKLRGLTPSRIRGLVVVGIVVLTLYVVLFESDPPPLFDEVEISIPERPQADFDERTIVLPEFEVSPAPDDSPTAEGVVIAIAEQQEVATPEPVVPEPAPAAPPPAETPAKPPPTSSTTPAAASTTLAVVDTSGWFVQFAALTNREAANKWATELGQILDEPTYVEETTRGDQKYFRVRLGPYGEDEARARTVLNRLREVDPAASSGAYVASN